MISRTNANLYLASVSKKCMKMKQIWPKGKYAYVLYWVLLSLSAVSGGARICQGAPTPEGAGAVLLFDKYFLKTA